MSLVVDLTLVYGVLGCCLIGAVVQHIWITNKRDQQHDAYMRLVMAHALTRQQQQQQLPPPPPQQP